jgi:hypothetical protein
LFSIVSRSAPAHPELLVVMPAYNEQAAITRVVIEAWCAALDESGGQLRAAGDRRRFEGRDPGESSKDSDPDARAAAWSSTAVPNRGHGQTCLEGYRERDRSRRFPFILQIDSDGQCDPVVSLAEFWALRHDHDVIYGRRSREDGLVRFVASFTLRHLVRVLEGRELRGSERPLPADADHRLRPGHRRPFLRPSTSRTSRFPSSSPANPVSAKPPCRSASASASAASPPSRCTASRARRFELFRQLKALRADGGW